MSHEPPPKAFPLYGYFGIVITLLGILGFLNFLAGDALAYEPILGTVVVITGAVLTGWALYQTLSR